MIHETAIIDPSAKIAEDVEIGPYSVVGPHVEIGEGTKIGSHVVIHGPTKIGKSNTIHQFASIGEKTQDLKYCGEPTFLEIGDNNVIREFCTFNRGTHPDTGKTIIGSHNLFMAYVHVAHDCWVGNHTIFSNNASLAGFVRIEDHVILGGFAGVYQHCRMGRNSFASMGSMINKDVPPFVKVSGYYAQPYGLNKVGLNRMGFSEPVIQSLNKAYKLIYRQGLTVASAIEEIKQLSPKCPEIEDLAAFVSESESGIVR